MATDSTTSADTHPTTPAISRRHRKHQVPDDPFLQLPISPARTPSPAASPDRTHPTAAQSDEESESLLTHLIISPILFTSFLLSLFLVDRRNRAWRLSQHPSSSNSTTSSSSSSSHQLFLFSRLSPWSWIDPEPYQDPADSTWQRGHGGAGGGNVPGEKRVWVSRKKHRKMMRLEVGEAFELRGRVILAMIGVGLLVVVGCCIGVKWIMGRVWRVL